MEANYDHVLWKSRGSHDITEDGIKIRIDYASNDKRPDEDSGRSDTRPVARAQPQQPMRPLNDGSKDMGSTANKVSPL